MGTFVGAATGGVDVIGRHQWQGSAALRTRRPCDSDRRATCIVDFLARICSVTLSSTWRLEQRVEAGDDELLRLERKRSAAVGVDVPWRTLRRSTLFSASLQIEDRHRETRGDAVAVSAPIRSSRVPTLIGGRLGLRLRPDPGRSAVHLGQDGIRMSAADRLSDRHRGRPLALGLGSGAHPRIDRFHPGRRPEDRCWLRPCASPNSEGRRRLA